MHWLGESHSLHDAGHVLQAPVALLAYVPAGQALTHEPPASARDPEHAVQASRAVQAAQPVAQGKQSPSASSKVPAGQSPAGARDGGQAEGRQGRVRFGRREGHPGGAEAGGQASNALFVTKGRVGGWRHHWQGRGAHSHEHRAGRSPPAHAPWHAPLTSLAPTSHDVQAVAEVQAVQFTGHGEQTLLAFA
jgi:hypothetical protein